MEERTYVKAVGVQHLAWKPIYVHRLFDWCYDVWATVHPVGRILFSSQLTYLTWSKNRLKVLSGLRRTKIVRGILQEAWWHGLRYVDIFSMRVTLFAEFDDLRVIGLRPIRIRICGTYMGTRNENDSEVQICSAIEILSSFSLFGSPPGYARAINVSYVVIDDPWPVDSLSALDHAQYLSQIRMFVSN